MYDLRYYYDYSYYSRSLPAVAEPTTIISLFG